MIRAIVQDEDGSQIGEGCDFPTTLFPSIEDSRFTCLRFVDPYGDTVFNHLQVRAILDELSQLELVCKDHSVRGMIGQLRTLADRCLSEPHLYLKLIGD